MLEGEIITCICLIIAIIFFVGVGTYELLYGADYCTPLYVRFSLFAICIFEALIFLFLLATIIYAEIT